MSAITGPIALYNNLPINAQYYQPSQFFISTITLGTTTTITTTVDHNYVIGQQIRLIIPPTFGCRQLNEQTGFVLSIPSATQVVVSINSVGGNVFTSSSAITQPQILAVGAINSGALNQVPAFTGTYIPGSFIDVSPN